jgi:hypothetical protein
MKVISYIFVGLLILLTVVITFFDGRRLVRQISDSQENSQQQVKK